jgi:predicted DNA-binding protein (UPF0251 family)
MEKSLADVTRPVEKSQTETDSEPTKIRKWPRKKKPEELTRIYKNYTEHDMRSCLEVIRQKQMTVSQACKYFGIPRKTVSSKLLNKQKKKMTG